MKKFNKNSIAVALVFSFVLGLSGVVLTSQEAVRAAQPTIDLKTAAPFAILAGTPDITDAANASTITGNVGLSPATAAGIGLFCSQLTGTSTIYGVDAAYVGDGIDTSCYAGNPPLSNKTLVDNAKLDLTAAFIDAAGRTPVTTVPTELGGTTKVAGVYDSVSTTFGITAGAGALVLDGQGDSSSVFIFEMDAAGTGLTVGPGSTVSLVNGAQACNVFWRLDTAAINSTAVFKGTILALNSITVANGANIEGRLLARNGNVTLINDTITVPTCVTGGSTTTTVVPSLPNTGTGLADKSAALWGMIVSTGVFVTLFALYIARKKRTI